MLSVLLVDINRLLLNILIGFNLCIEGPARDFFFKVYGVGKGSPNIIRDYTRIRGWVYQTKIQSDLAYLNGQRRVKKHHTC